MSPPVGAARSGVVGAQTGDALPDSGDLQFGHDVRALSLSDTDPVTSWQDQSGNGHNLTDDGSPPTFRTDQLSGLDVVRFDDDYMEVSFAEVSQPTHVAMLFRFRSFASSDRNSIFDGINSSPRQNFGNQDGGWFAFSGSQQITGGSVDTNPHIAVISFNGSDSYVRIDGSQVASGDPGAQGLAEYRLGAEDGLGTFAAIDVVEQLAYTQDKTAINTDIESYLDRDTDILS